MKYGIDAGNDYFEGREIRDFDLGGTVSNAVYSVLWGDTYGNYIFNPIMKSIQKSGKKLECYT